MSIKQRKIKIEPRKKLNHNIIVFGIFKYYKHLWTLAYPSLFCQLENKLYFGSMPTCIYIMSVGDFFNAFLFLFVVI